MKWPRLRLQKTSHIRWQARGAKPIRDWDGVVKGEVRYSILQELNSLWALGLMNYTEGPFLAWRRLRFNCSLEEAKRFAEQHLIESVKA